VNESVLSARRSSNPLRIVMVCSPRSALDCLVEHHLDRCGGADREGRSDGDRERSGRQPAGAVAECELAANVERALPGVADLSGDDGTAVRTACSLQALHDEVAARLLGAADAELDAYADPAGHLERVVTAPLELGVSWLLKVPAPSRLIGASCRLNLAALAGMLVAAGPPQGTRPPR